MTRTTSTRYSPEMRADAGRGKPARATVSDSSAPCPRDKVTRRFRAPAPNPLGVSDLTHVPTWAGLVYTAFVIDAIANRIVGWRVSRSAKTDLALDALEQALWVRRPGRHAIIHDPLETGRAMT